MAEMEVKDSGGKKHKGTKGKKLSTRVDLTPMVDLGFLLITFFMLTTTLAKPKTMELIMPKDTQDEKERNKVKASTALTILLGKKHRVYYYEGIGDDPNAISNPDFFKVTTFKEKGGIRQVILDKKAKVEQLRNAKGEPEKMVVLIKPNDEASYKDVVDVLDEMQICRVPIYAIIDISDVEKGWIKATEQSNEAK